MFFVQKVVDWRRREFFLIHWLPTIVIFVAFMGVTLWSWQAAVDRAEQDRRQELIRTTEEIKNRISERINVYQEISRAGVVLFKSSDEVTRSEWKTFAELYGIEQRHPIIRGVSYLEVVPRAQLASHTAKVKSEAGYKNYSVYPASDRDFYISLIYTEPDKKNNPAQENIGFDILSSPVRKSAIETAMNTGNPTLAEIASQDNNDGIPSIAIYSPVFKNQKTQAKSLDDVSGFIQVTIRDDRLFQSVIPEDPNNNFSERIYAKDNATTPFYESDDFSIIKNSKGSVEEVSTLDLGNTNWVIQAVSSQNSGTPEIQERPTNILIGGTLISLVMASFVYYLLLIRTRAIAHKEDIEIQSAKDELLALASHQLRTPATGVKQYVGMLLQGYAGHLSPKQTKLLNKANESNERQLTTINEMLSVARADAGRLRIEPIRTNINGLVEDVVEEQRHTIEKRGQKITLSLPREDVHCYVDPQYFRMAIENIISNASKYTPENGAIDITLDRTKNKTSISVEDTGIGIPVRHYSMLFKKFSRIPNDFSNRVSGSGIGLYLAKHIVEAHDGQLTFSSDPGVGSTFKIVLPNRKKRSVQ